MVLSMVFCIGLMIAGSGTLLGNPKIELRAMSVEGPESQVVINKILDEFEKENPNISVKIDYTTWDKVGQKMLTGFAAGTVADVLESGADWTGPSLATFPVVFVFLILQRYFVHGIAMTGLKA